MPHDPSSDPGGASRGERLRAARRLDARFLLADPDLGRAVVVGTPDPLLVQAVGAGRPGGSADTVFLGGRWGRAALVAAAEAAGPAGRLVIERDARHPFAPGRPPATERIVRSLMAGGWGTVTTWLTWPARDRPSVWVSVDDPAGVRALVERRLGGTRLARVAGLAGRIAGRAIRGRAGRRMLLEIAPAVTIVAEREGGKGSWVAGRLAADRGILLVTPHFHASAHVVGLALDPGTGTPTRVLKAARLVDDPGIGHEAAMLSAIEAACPGSDEMPGPRLVDADTAQGHSPSLVETGVAGVPLDQRAVRADRAAAVAGVASWLSSLPVAPAGARRRPVHERLADALAAVCRLDPRPGDGDLATLVRRTEAVLAILHDADLPTVFEHGDAAHPNLIRRPDGRIKAVDWERAEPDGLPLHDLTIALGYVAAAMAGATTPAAQAAAFRDALTGGDPWAAAALDTELRRLGVDPVHRPALVVAAWLRSAAWLAQALAPVGADRVAADWLTGDRSLALWRVSLDVAESSGTAGERRT